jgi:hypothetical protein
MENASKQPMRYSTTSDREMMQSSTGKKKPRPLAQPGFLFKAWQ